MNPESEDRLNVIVRIKERLAESVRWLDCAAEHADFTGSTDRDEAANFSYRMTEARIALEKACRIFAGSDE